MIRPNNTNVSHNNGLGFLRLLFASLVIIGHTAEIADGDRTREPLTQVFGTISLGELSVDCFFLISGFLIVGSFVGSTSTASYLRKRFYRIYPAFLVASVLSVVIFAPLGGASPADVMAALPKAALNIALMQPVDVAGVFDGAPLHYLNASLWTISYEFRCYLLVILLGWTAALSRPVLLAAIAAIGMGVFVAAPFGDWSAISIDLPLARAWIGRPGDAIRLTSIFLAGALFYLWRDRIAFTAHGVVFAVIGLIIGLGTDLTAEPSIAIFGGYLIFAFSSAARDTVFSRVNSRDDISYGVYLYGWPIGALILWHAPGLPLSAVMAATIAFSIAFGWVSWRGLERPVMRRMTARRDHVGVPMVRLDDGIDTPAGNTHPN